MHIDGLPESFRSDLEIAVSVLTGLGARQVFVFGSVVRREPSSVPRDIDIAVSGLPPEKFFHAYGQLMMRLQHDVDLVDLDDDAEFVRVLKETGQLERVA